MAEVVTVGDQQYKRRNPFGVWVLAIITGGIYGLVWYYKINDEAKRYLGDEAIKPWVSVVAVLFGWVLIVPPFVSYYQTGGRIQRMQEQAGLQQRISPGLGLLAAFFASLHIPYMQHNLNGIWDQVRTPLAAPTAG